MFEVILHNTSSCLHNHFVKAHSILCANSMSEALTKNAESLQAPIDCFLAILCPGSKLFEFRRVPIVDYNALVRLPIVATVSDTFFIFSKLGVESIFVPIVFITCSVLCVRARCFQVQL